MTDDVNFMPSPGFGPGWIVQHTKPKVESILNVDPVDIEIRPKKTGYKIIVWYTDGVTEKREKVETMVELA